jgi:hypothetical protein
VLHLLVVGDGDFDPHPGRSVRGVIAFSPMDGTQQTLGHSPPVDLVKQRITGIRAPRARESKLSASSLLVGQGPRIRLPVVV